MRLDPVWVQAARGDRGLWRRSAGRPATTGDRFIGNSVGLRVELQPATVEVDRGLEVLAVAESVGTLLYRLDLGV